VSLLAVYLIHLYSVDGAMQTWLERPDCDKQRSASCKLQIAQSSKMRATLPCFCALL